MQKLTWSQLGLSLGLLENKCQYENRRQNSDSSLPERLRLSG